LPQTIEVVARLTISEEDFDATAWRGAHHRLKLRL
jgi:hypothetical protein